jgi:hypothetical protein
MLKLKKGVRLRGLRPEMSMGNDIVADVFEKRSYDCIITSANDGRHGVGSLHFSGQALDYRTKHITGSTRSVTIASLIGEARRNLGADFDVIHEDYGGDNEHLHVEYQPKKA